MDLRARLRQIVFEALQQSAGRRAVLRDDGAFPVFRDAIDRAVPPDPAPVQPLPADAAQGAGTRSRNLPSLAPDPEPTHARSRFEPGAGTVLYNDRHADYLLVQDEESPLFDYLATLVAKEYVVYNNPRSSSDDYAEEMVRMLVRVRRHLPRRR